MPRPQVSLKTMLWVRVCVACYLAGVASHRAYVEHRGADALKKCHETFVSLSLN
jgi:hypothetical protein